MNHELTIERNFYTGGFTGICSCSDPEWAEEGVWVGQVQFEGNTEDDVRDFHEDHASDVA